jgi:hypothetical protein
MTWLMPRLPMSCMQMYCVCLHWHNRTDEALPMSCIQMYYVCVFTIQDIGNVPSVLLCQWRHTHSIFVYRTLLMPRLSYYVNEDTHIVHLYTGHWSCSVCPIMSIKTLPNVLYTNVLCVFIDIIGQTRHYQCPVYKCTMCVSSLT